MRYEHADLDRMEHDPSNVRKFSPPEMQTELRECLEQNGQYVAMIGYMLKDRLMIFDGHCRLDAMRELEWKKGWVCILDKPPDAAELLIAQIHVNSRRQELNPVDLLLAYQQLMTLRNLSPTQLAAAVGVKPPKVTPILALGKLEERHLELVRNGSIPLSTAYGLARMDASERDACVEQVLSGKLKRDQVQAKVRKQSKGEQVKSRRVCCQLPGGTVSVSAANGLSLSSLIVLLDGLLRQCKKARANGWDISTAVCVLRDTAHKTDAMQATQ